MTQDTVTGVRVIVKQSSSQSAAELYREQLADLRVFTKVRRLRERLVTEAARECVYIVDTD